MSSQPIIEMISLQCAVKKYHWGKKGSNSVIARIIKQQNPDFHVDETSPYAELWIGTHSSGPAIITSNDPNLSNQPLSIILNKTPEYVGTVDMIAKYGRNMPFLFKVLSIEQPLSIQSHPDKELAKLLNESDPKNYPDTNHKPEMAIAVTEMGALLSFRPISEIKKNVEEIPELRAVVGEEAIAALFDVKPEMTKRALQVCFSSLMNASQEIVATNLKMLHERLNEDEGQSTMKTVFNVVYSHYPNDIGCFSLFFLNFILLKPFEAIFLPPNEPHAYLFGDCVECMACSDNVIRAGLTPKYKDVQTLCKSLTYECKNIEQLILKPTIINEQVKVYKPEVEEFAVECIDVKKDSLCVLSGKSSGSFLVVIDGSARVQSTGFELYAGFTCFIPALTEIKLDVTDDMVMFRSFCPN